tara:strand:- start:94 stop:834 length:741 start_codon:yes stop_codon:yes gene_type:complete
MKNILFALGIGIAIFAVLYFPELLRLGEAIVPAVLASMIAYFVLARRAFKKVETIFGAASQFLQSPPPKFDLAIRKMEEAYALGPYQIGIKSQVDAQIGTLYFLQKEFNKALPYLQRSLGFGHWMSGAMLAVIYYKKKNHDEMRKTFEVVTKRAKKQGIVWNLYAYLLCQIGEKDAAQQILITALKKTKNDAKVQESLLNLQNGKKIKMKSYKEQWYQFHLERPPTQYQQAQVGGKISKQQRRGRW